MKHAFDIIWALLNDGFFAAIAAIGFALISNPSKRMVPYEAMLAAIGHMIRYACMHYLGWDITSSSFMGAFGIGWVSIWFSMKAFTPTTTLYIPALLPMVPGIYAYNTVFAIAKFVGTVGNQAASNTYLLEFLSNGITTITVIVCLAIGATLPTFMCGKKRYEMTRASRKTNKIKIA